MAINGIAASALAFAAALVGEVEPDRARRLGVAPQLLAAAEDGVAGRGPGTWPLWPLLLSKRW